MRQQSALFILGTVSTKRDCFNPCLERMTLHKKVTDAKSVMTELDRLAIETFALRLDWLCGFCGSIGALTETTFSLPADSAISVGFSSAPICSSGSYFIEPKSRSWTELITVIKQVVRQYLHQSAMGQYHLNPQWFSAPADSTLAMPPHSPKITVSIIQ